MANRTEEQVGMALESTYNTPVTPTRFYPYIDSTDAQWDTRQRQGQSVFVGSKRGWRGDRRVLPIGQGTLVLKTELASRQGMLLLYAATGVQTVTALTGGALGLFRTSITNTTLPSFTIQYGKVQNNGTVDPETFAGCTAVSFEIECPEDNILTIQVTFDARSFTTATALATASYTAGAYLFDHSQGAAALGGTFTAPTTTALGSTSGGAYTNIRTWKFTVDQAADIARWVLGGRNQPTAGMLTPELTFDLEFNDDVAKNLYLAGTGFPLTLTHTTSEVVGSGFSQFQLALPQLFLKTPEMAPVDTDTSVVSGAADVTFDGTNELFYLVYRTADTVL